MKIPAIWRTMPMWKFARPWRGARMSDRRSFIISLKMLRRRSGREIAANKATPAQANLLLASDDHEEVRYDLARKIARLLPELTASEQTKVGELTIQALEILAQDQLPKVRALLSDELKHSVDAPHNLIKQLALDIEAIVCTPILEYSPLLSDDDLLEIITSGVASAGLSAIASRDSVAPPVSDAIVATLDVPAVASLLGNPSAQIREETLDRIIDNAVDVQSWHEPLVVRPELSVRAVRRIATFVARSLIERLVETHDLDAETESSLRQRVEGRIQDDRDSDDDGSGKVAALAASGGLNEASVAEAIVAGDRKFVHEALAHLAGYSIGRVERIPWLRQRAGGHGPGVACQFEHASRAHFAAACGEIAEQRGLERAQRGRLSAQRRPDGTGARRV